MPLLVLQPNVPVQVPGQGKLYFVPDPLVNAPAAAVPLMPAALGTPITNATGRLLTLHHQMSNIAYGGVAWEVVGSVAGFRMLIQQARAAGADCLFLNDGGGLDKNYTDSRTNIYLAANLENAANGWTPGKVGTTNALGVGKVSLYEGFDFSNPALENTATIVSVLTPLLQDPANLTINGRPVYSCYTGGGGRSWASLAAIFGPANTQLTTGGVKPYVIWGGEATNSDGSPSDGSLASLTAWCNGCVKPFADAVWSYGANSNAPLGLTSSIFGQERLAQAAKTSGLAFQGSVYPGYAFGRNWVHVGPDGLKAQWRSVLDTQKPSLGVQVTTADDGPTGEQSNLLFGWDPATYTPDQGPDFAQSTDGKIASNSQYVHEMKTGQKPVFGNDTLIVWQPVQTGPAQASPSADPRGPLSGVVTKDGYVPAAQLPGLTDVECLLSASAQVRVTSVNVPAATHTSLVSWNGDSYCVYDPVNPFTGVEVGQTLQIVGGSGWTAGNYTVDRYLIRDTQDGQQTLLHLTQSPASGSVRGGQGTLYAAGTTPPPLPPAPIVTTVFASAGQSFFQFPNQAGNTQRVELLRGGQVILTIAGHAIAGTAVYANSNYWTGTAHN